MLETRRSDTSVIEDIGEDVALEDNEIHLRKIQQRVEKERFYEIMVNQTEIFLFKSKSLKNRQIIQLLN